MPIFQCPECDLRFTSASERDGHLRDEHPEFRAERPQDEASPIPPWQRHQKDREAEEGP